MSASEKKEGSGGVDLREWSGRALYLAAVVAVLALYLYSVRDVLSPVVLFLLFLFLVTPLYGTRLYQSLVVAASGLLLLWLLDTTGFLFAPFILALILAYILDPLVDLLERYRLRRSWAILALALPVLGGTLVALLIGVPALAREFTSFVDRLVPPSVESVTAWLDRGRDRIVALGIPGLDAESVPRIGDFDTDAVVHFLNERRELIVERAWRAVLGVGKGIGFLLTVVAYLVLTPVLAYYLLRDYDRLKRVAVELIPGDRRARWLGLVGEYDRLLARYLRGQLLVALIVGVLTYLGFLIVGFPYPLMLGAIAGIFNLVPFLGLVVSLIPALLIAFASGAVWISLLKIAVVIGAIQTFESTVLSPQIVGGSVGLNPVWVILALAIFGFFFGFVGLLIAVPLAVLLRVVLSRAVAAYRRSIYYGASAEGSS